MITIEKTKWKIRIDKLINPKNRIKKTEKK
jgi:hypothetical protein